MVGIHRADPSLEDVHWTEDVSILVFVRVVLYGRTEGPRLRKEEGLVRDETCPPPSQRAAPPNGPTRVHVTSGKDRPADKDR